jgi:hypothetical protein
MSCPRLLVLTQFLPVLTVPACASQWLATGAEIAFAGQVVLARYLIQIPVLSRLPPAALGRYPAMLGEHLDPRRKPPTERPHLCDASSWPIAPLTMQNWAGIRAGTRRPRLFSMTGFSAASVLGWQSSRLPTDHAGMAEVSRRARDARPCPRQKRTVTPSAAMHKHTAHRTVGRALTRDCLQPTPRRALDNRALPADRCGLRSVQAQPPWSCIAGRSAHRPWPAGRWQRRPCRRLAGWPAE